MTPRINLSLRRFVSGDRRSGNGEEQAEQPFRAELFSVVQLERHARAIAGLHQTSTARSKDILLPRLDENEAILDRTYELLTASVEKHQPIIPTAEWLLDNFYIIKEHIRAARLHLPKSYSRELPTLVRGAAAGAPRAYGIAMELIAHVDGGVDMVNLGAFLASYQSVRPLTIGELWAIPIMLRLALIENLRRVSVRLQSGMRDRTLAQEWADRMAAVVEKKPNDLVMVLADLAKASPPLSSAFVAELVRHLQGHGPHYSFALSWLEHRLAEHGMKIDQLVQIESQQQAADHVSVGNSVTSLRFIGSTDWREFVESQSVVEQTLRGDPAGVYGKMNFGTRDLYRHAVEKIAKRCKYTELDVARAAVQLAAQAAHDPADGRKAHVGYYLLDDGRPQLEKAVAVRPSARQSIKEAVRKHPLLVYLGAIASITAGLSAAFGAWASSAGVDPWILAVLALPAVVASSQIAVGIVNWVVTASITPRPLPRMDFSDGIPPEHRTIVVIPTLLTDRKTVSDLLERLEINYVANPEENLHFALLTDFTDAPRESMPDDDALIQLVSEGIAALNQKYQRDRLDVFYLFHRPRKYNARDGIWMGYERKRGKINEFNALLRGKSRECFSQIVGDCEILSRIRYAITLDTDTQLPRETARKMVAAMAHPLNRPQFDPIGCRVVKGYGILQPRVGISIPSASRSWYVKLFAPSSGLDPYTRVVSDVYQDLFGEGSFIGKGIYDIDAFAKASACFPEYTILSHDLLESAYARSGLISDVELYEEHPSRHLADARRRHRWIRGDWQIAFWLLPWVPTAQGWSRNPISALSWWKIFDNLRRSLVPVAMLAVLLAGWLLAPATSLPLIATCLVLSIVLTVPLLTTAAEALRVPRDVPLAMHLRSLVPIMVREVSEAFFTLSFLPFEAYLSVDAIVRTLLRMMITRRNLLEWTTFSQVEATLSNRLSGAFAAMWFAPATAVVVAAALLWRAGGDIPPFTLPLLVLWTIAPVFSYVLSRPIAAPRPHITPEQQRTLRKISRMTWRYFEDFVTQEENWLPPDNFQEHPSPMIASRTSPTNIGVALLCNLAAHDFGYCSTASFLHRTRETLATMGRMERYRGHWYNWYETRTLRPLPPLYVSTVDSGNLAIHLAVLRHGLLEAIESTVLPRRAFDGVRDTLIVLRDVVQTRIDATQASANSALREIARKVDRLDEELTHVPETMSAIMVFLQRLSNIASEMAPLAPQEESQIRAWARACERGIAEFSEEIAFMTPWVALPPPPESMWRTGLPEQVRRLDEVRAQLAALEHAPRLRQVAELDRTIAPKVQALLETYERAEGHHGLEARQWLEALLRNLSDGAQRARNRIRAFEDAAELCNEYTDMDFVFLYDEQRSLFSIGYNVSAHRLDTSYYDLLASEARVSSFFAIAQGQLSQSHWFALSRLLTTTAGSPALLSWSGSMFEYLMPLLVMPIFENTLLAQTAISCVRRQIDYARQRGIPWGISESAFNSWDLHMVYQYRAFGVPGLGLKRGLADDLVIAPYATVMALMVEPEAACKNIERLIADGRLGAYGFYEAVDYTQSRLPPGADSVSVRTFMGHHQGMSFLSLAYLLLDRPMQRRFSADPNLRATELLLQERIPRAAPTVMPHPVETLSLVDASAQAEGTMRVLTRPNDPQPEVHLLSNGRYHVVVSAAGGGYSRWNQLAVTRWREDGTRDCWGTFVYIRDIDSGKFWSNTYQPTLKTSNEYQAVFMQARAEFRRIDDQIECHTELSVSPEDDIELRRMTFTNHSDRPRTIEVTSFAEVVLAPLDNDTAHPAFSNLFVQTELLRARNTILCTRRARTAEERTPWMLHMLSPQGQTIGRISFETDRSKFLGRARSAEHPAAMDRRSRLTDSEGAVLDPAVAIRCTLRIPPNQNVRVDLVNGVAETKEGAIAFAEKYNDPRLADRVFELAWTHSRVQLRHLNATEAEAQTYAKLAGSLIYASHHRRAASSILHRNLRTQSGLWRYGISGDVPIVLVRVRNRDKLDLVRQALQAHAYWRYKGLTADLVIWNEDDSVYRQDMHETIMSLVAASAAASLIDQPGGVFVRRSEQIAEEDKVLMQAVARIVLRDTDGSLREQVERRRRVDPAVPALRPTRHWAPAYGPIESPKRDLAFFNGVGGFTHDGREYIMILRPGQSTPAPWCNVIANPDFGTVVSESGSVYTWSENCHEFRITPWHGDPVTGESGEAVYIRDEESGRFWSPCPYPARGTEAYVVRHGFGYSVFEHVESGISSEMMVYVALDKPVKFVRLKLANRSGRPRKLSITSYWELVLGEHASKTRMHVVTETDPTTSAIFARNPYHTELGTRVVFADCSVQQRTITGDRAEFLGRNGSYANPAAMHRVRLSNRVGAGLDPCAAIMAPVSLDDGQEVDIIFTVGAAQSEDQARGFVKQSRGIEAAQGALEGVWQYWGRTLGAVYVETPDPAFNFLANGWLLYQTLSCRVWARSGFYQSGGAYGFRDQLQDTMALLHAEPRILREQLLRAASRQFREGDVQHWWHPHSGRGVRTHCSDDFLWLPYATCRYVLATGDTGVLDERAHYLDGRPVRDDEEGYYDLPQVLPETGTLYEHCLRAIDNGMRFGPHNLPLMGSGDWNDGMNLVGAQGRGESVWMAFFLYDVLNQFSELARRRGDTATVDKCARAMEGLRRNVDQHAWDGEWYRRAYFDNGEPLGSAQNPECKIDSLPQSWSVLTQMGDPERARIAMESVYQRLVRKDARIIQLLDPPFDKSHLDPGYIKGYLPGVRENGGQYTHAAIWAVMAFAGLRDAQRAWECFSLINPVLHGAGTDDIRIYKVEPYVVAADVYSAVPHTGRGGWTWYTGSAGWMYRLLTESILGIRLDVDKLRFSPCIPPDWPQVTVHYRYRETVYHIVVRKDFHGAAVKRVVVDGREQPEPFIPLIDDRVDHHAEVELD